jgi:hypothetical protein
VARVAARVDYAGEELAGGRDMVRTPASPPRIDSQGLALTRLAMAALLPISAAPLKRGAKRAKLSPSDRGAWRPPRGGARSGFAPFLNYLEDFVTTTSQDTSGSFAG